MSSLRRAAVLMAVILGAGLHHGRAGADVGPPAGVRLVGEFQPAERGALFSGTIRLDVIQGEWVQEVLFPDQAGWELVSFRRLPGGRSDQQDFAIEARAVDPSAPLEFEVIGDDWSARLGLEVSQAALDRATSMARTTKVPQAPRRSAIRPARQGKPGPPKRAITITPQEFSGVAPHGKAAGARTITVQGHYGAYRSYDYGEGIQGDNAWISLHGASVYLYEVGESIFFPPTLLDSQYTDEYGNFSFTYDWNPAVEGEEDPDFMLVCALEAPENAIVDPTTYTPYAYRSQVVNNFSGTVLDFGAETPGLQIDRGRFCLFTHMQRCHEFFLAHGGAADNVPFLYTLHPDGWPRANGSIAHFPDDSRAWDSYTPFHERGHHWAFNIGAYTRYFDYCDPEGDCDDPNGGDCGHCIWCDEEEAVAFNEGLGQWVGDAGSLWLASTYGEAPAGMRNIEVLGKDCGTPGHCTCDPLITEGMFAATLFDVSDAAGDNDPKFTADAADALSLGNLFITDFMRTVGPGQASPELCLRFLRDSFPGFTFDFWETFANNGYDFDVTEPGTPLNFSSPSHPENTSSYDRTIDLEWDQPTDDWSGPGGYSINIASSIVAPDLVPEVTDPDQTTWTSPPVSAGTWYVTVRAVDRAGHWSGVMATHGPIYIDASDPLDLTFRSHTGWAEVVVPRGAADATGSLVPAPTELRGDGTLTYGNLRGGNDATLQPSTDFSNRFLLDGYTVLTAAQTPVQGGDSFRHINVGPVYVSGGLHTFAGGIDYHDEVTESDEDNNLWGGQWAWLPGSTMNVEQLNTYPPPPRRDGGWEALEGPPWFNVRGMRFLPSGFWTAVAMWPDKSYADHDLRLHPASTGPDNGFRGSRGWSSRPGGCTDAVIINRNVEPTSPSTPWDVGVLNYTAQSSNTHMMVIESGWVDFGTTKQDTFDAHLMLDLHEFLIQTGNEGWVNATLRVSPFLQPVHLNLLRNTMATGDLHDGLRIGTTEEQTGVFSTDVQILNTGYYAAVVYRDKFEGNSLLPYTLTIRPSTAELSPYVDETWAGAIVPRDQQDLVHPWPNVPYPTVLVGEVQPTYAYVRFHNSAPVGSGAFRVQLEIDGVGGAAYDIPSGLTAGEIGQFTTGGGFSVRGGRHNLGVVVDSLDDIAEPLEDNNEWAHQWYWAPPVQDIGPRTAKPTPPDRTGGWDAFPGSERLAFNFDAIRTPVFDPGGQHDRVVGVAMIPEGDGQYDILISGGAQYPMSAFREHGFSTGWDVGESNFFVIDLQNSHDRQFDVGVQRMAGSGEWNVQVVEAVDRGHEPHGRWPERAMATTDILHLYRMNLEIGEHRFDLESVSGGIDWGISLYRADREFKAKALTNNMASAAWLNGGGADEGFDTTIDEAGDYVLAVWKVGTADLDLGGDYRIVLQSQVTDVPVLAGGDTRISAVSPNPLNPRLTVDFYLSRRTPARLGIYSLRGELVRSLVNETLPAGSHKRVWDGRDAQGRAAPSGIYMVRLAAEGRVDHQKVTLLK